MVDLPEQEYISDAGKRTAGSGLFQLATTDRGGLNPAGAPFIKSKKLFR